MRTVAAERSRVRSKSRTRQPATRNATIITAQVEESARGRVAMSASRYHYTLTAALGRPVSTLDRWPWQATAVELAPHELREERRPRIGRDGPGSDLHRVRVGAPM